MSTVGDLLRDALLELALIDPVDPTPPDAQTFALARLNGILDLWNTQSQTVYAVTFGTFTTTSGLSPHTIGLAANTPTWTVTTQRPVAVLGANQQISSGTDLTNIGPLTLRDRAWWLRQAVPNLQSGVPTDLYYEPSWPNGAVYLWPVPNAAYVVQLELSVVLAQVAITDVVSLPPGYARALMLTLAEDLEGPLGAVPSLTLATKARQARAAIFETNNQPVRIRTRQSGVPGGGAGGFYNWRSGVVEG